MMRITPAPKKNRQESRMCYSYEKICLESCEGFRNASLYKNATAIYADSMKTGFVMKRQMFQTFRDVFKHPTHKLAKSPSTYVTHEASSTVTWWVRT
jgi:hypothetical protein